MTILLIKCIKVILVIGFAKIAAEMLFNRHDKRYLEIVDLTVLLMSLYIVEFILAFSFSPGLQFLKPGVAVLILWKLHHLFYKEN